VGLVEGSDGRALTPSFMRLKNGRLYRYYRPVRENTEHAGAPGLLHLPAEELETAMLGQLRRVLRALEMIAGVTERAVGLYPVLDEAQVTVAMIRLDSIREQLFPAEQQRIVRLLIELAAGTPLIWEEQQVRLETNRCVARERPVDFREKAVYSFLSL
jgi:site-specific DNA recombinase